MDDIQNLFKETMAEFTESRLESGLNEELGYSYNGYSSKTFTVSVIWMSQYLKIAKGGFSIHYFWKKLSTYGKGMSTGGIENHIRDIHSTEVSDTTVSQVTDIILP